MKEIVGVLVFSMVVSLLEYWLWKDGFSWVVFIWHTVTIIYILFLIGDKK